MKLKPQTALIITLIIFVLGITITSAAGLYQTTTNKTPGKIETAGYTEQNDPAGIRGSYTIGDVSRLYGIPLDVLTEAFGLEAGAVTVKVSELGSLSGDAETEIGPPAVRLFVAYYLEPALRACGGHIGCLNRRQTFCWARGR